MIVCKRCGRCCKIVINGQKSGEDCPYLVRFKSGLTACRVYKNRLSAILPHNNRCILRVNDEHNYFGCPYNNPDWPFWEV